MVGAVLSILSCLCALNFLSAAEGADLDSSILTCPQGLKLGIYDTPKEGTRYWRNKYIRCENLTVTCPPRMKPVYYDRKVYGSTPLDNGSFVRCEEGRGGID